MTVATILNFIGVFLIVICFYFTVEIYKLVRARLIMVLSVAMIWSFTIRILSLSGVAIVKNNSSAFQLGSWVILTLGFFMLFLVIKRFMK